MDSTYDGIILGAGHNGLILQAYLGKAGLKTLAGGKRILVAGQKSGNVWAYDPDNKGAVVWRSCPLLQRKHPLEESNNHRR